MKIFKNHPLPWLFAEDNDWIGANSSSAQYGIKYKSSIIYDANFKIVIILNSSMSEYEDAMSEEDAKALVEFVNSFKPYA